MLEAVANLAPIEHVRRNFSDAHRAALSLAKKGNTNASGAVRSDETRAKLSAALKGNVNAARRKVEPKKRLKAGWQKFRRSPGEVSSTLVDPDFDDELSMPELNTKTDW
jgi:hypothetical protein